MPLGFAISILGLVLTPLQALVGIISVKRESRIGQYLAIVCNLAAIALIALELSATARNVNEIVRTLLPRTAAYAGIAFPLLLATAALNIKCMRNFDQGLKAILRRGQVHPDRTSRQTRRSAESGDGMKAHVHLEPLRSRMDIE